MCLFKTKTGSETLEKRGKNQLSSYWRDTALRSFYLALPVVVEMCWNIYELCQKFPTSEPPGEIKFWLGESCPWARFHKSKAVDL